MKVGRIVSNLAADASEGGLGSPFPDLLSEGADVWAPSDARSAARLSIEYGPIDEALGVRRLCACDPFGKVVNILVHIGAP